MAAICFIGNPCSKSITHKEQVKMWTNYGQHDKGPEPRWQGSMLHPDYLLKP